MVSAGAALVRPGWALTAMRATGWGTMAYALDNAPRSSGRRASGAVRERRLGPKRESARLERGARRSCRERRVRGSALGARDLYAAGPTGLDPGARARAGRLPAVVDAAFGRTARGPTSPVGGAGAAPRAADRTPWCGGGSCCRAGGRLGESSNRGPPHTSVGIGAENGRIPGILAWFALRLRSAAHSEALVKVRGRIGPSLGRRRSRPRSRLRRRVLVVVEPFASSPAAR